MRARSPRARGLRTLQHQRLPAATCYAIDTEVWFRGLILGPRPDKRQRGRTSRSRRWATKDQIYDEAIAWFLAQHARAPVQADALRRGDGEDLTFWLDSKLMERARRMALRDGVKLAHLIEIALSAYVSEQLSEVLIAFRRRVQDQACRLYQAHSPNRRRSTRRARAR